MSASVLKRAWGSLLSILPSARTDPASYVLAVAQVPTLLGAAVVVFVATNWVIEGRYANWILPAACMVSFLLFASILAAGRKVSSRAGLRRRIVWAHVATSLSAMALIAGSIAIADGLGGDTVPGLVLICLNASMAILVGLAFSPMPTIGTLQLLIAGAPGMAKVIYDRDPDAIAIGFMFVGIVALMIRFVTLANAERHRLIEARRVLARKTFEAEESSRAAQAADRAKSEFLANMSHEIRTPMNGVLGMAELLAKTELDSRQKTFTDVIIKSGKSLLSIINDVLDFSRIDAGEMTLDPAPFRPVDAIEDVVNLMSARAAQKDLELIVQFGPGLPATVIGDVGRFRQVVTNLVGNAVKFTEKGYVLVDVSARLADGIADLAVAVEDTGVGIPPDRIDAVFEKFAQADNSSTRRHEGTGLGLAIAARLVALMGGQIGAESEPGDGSVFRFHVPLPVGCNEEAPRAAPPALAGKRILVVEGNQRAGEVYAGQLKAWGFDCAVAENGTVGLHFIEQAGRMGAAVDCVLLDCTSNPADSESLLEALRSRTSTTGLPVVVLIPVDTDNCTRLSIKYNIAAQLAKPPRNAAFFSAIVNALNPTRIYAPGEAVRHADPAAIAAGSRQAGATAEPETLCA